MNATEDWRRLDASSRLLALSGLVFVPGLIRLRLKDLQAPLTVAGLWFGAITLSQYVAHPEQRSFGLYSYENMMGFAAMGNALLLAGTIGSGHDRRTVMATIGVVASLGAVVLSGTRGAWPGLLPLLWLLASRQRSGLPAGSPQARSTFVHRAVVWGMAAAVALAVAVPLKTRLLEAGTDVAHLQHGDLGGSLGMRVMMARTAIDMIRTHPWSGNGLSAFNRHIVQWADEIGIHKTAMERGFQNPHNQYLHWALSLGLPAAAACLALIVVFPAWLSWRRDTSDPQARRALRALVFTVPIYFLSEAILDRHHGAQWFSLVYGLLIGMCLQAKAPPATRASSTAA
jgi:O-antigen ligase